MESNRFVKNNKRDDGKVKMWICNCSAKNYMNRTSCYKCHDEKPTDAEVVEIDQPGKTNDFPK